MKERDLSGATLLRTDAVPAKEAAALMSESPDALGRCEEANTEQCEWRSRYWPANYKIWSELDHLLLHPLLDKSLEVPEKKSSANGIDESKKSEADQTNNPRLLTLMSRVMRRVLMSYAYAEK